MTHLLSPVLVPGRGTRRLILGWAERSQLQARRNAMVATTALAQASRERAEVAAYLDAELGRGPSVSPQQVPIAPQRVSSA